MSKTLRQFIFYPAVLIVWQVLASMKLWPPYLFPTPLGVLESLRDGFAEHSFWIGIGISMRRLLIGYGISVVLGVALGVALAFNRVLEETLGRFVVSVQSLPSICWVPLAILWFGLTENAILFVVVMGSLCSIVISAETALRNIPKIYPMAGRNLGTRRFRLFFLVFLPASLPNLVSGLKQGWAFAWRSLIGGEMLFVNLGLGQLLGAGRNLNDINLVAAVMVLIVALGYIVDTLLFRVAERVLREKWGLAASA
jgi:NitT/TauT family transport system permease protein